MMSEAENLPHCPDDFQNTGGTLMDNNMNQDIWQQPDSQFTQTPPKKNYDTAVLVLGIVSAVLALISSCIICCSPIPFVTAILAIVFAIITTRNGYDWNAMRIVGLVLGIVAILGLALWFKIGRAHV